MRLKRDFLDIGKNMSLDNDNHVESIVLLSKLKSNKLKHLNVKLEMDELDLTTAESKATYEEIKDCVLKPSGLKVSNLYIAQELGISGRQGCMGPGWPANASIGRAINLVIMNVLRSVPGVCDLDCIASQAEFTYCFAEEPDLAQWNMINEDRFDSKTTTVYLLKAEPLHDIIDFLSLNGHDLLDNITACCTTLGSNNAYMPGPLVVCLTPDHAMMLKKDGYTKEMIQEHIHQYVYHQTPMVNGRGLMPVRPKEWDNRHPLPVTRFPRDVEVVTIGGRGGHSGVVLPWALHSEGCVEALRLPDGRIAGSMEDFRRKV